MTVRKKLQDHYRLDKLLRCREQ